MHLACFVLNSLFATCLCRSWSSSLTIDSPSFQRCCHQSFQSQTIQDRLHQHHGILTRYYTPSILQLKIMSKMGRIATGITSMSRLKLEINTNECNFRNYKFSVYLILIKMSHCAIVGLWFPSLLSDLQRILWEYICALKKILCHFGYSIR